MIKQLLFRRMDTIGALTNSQNIVKAYRDAVLSTYRSQAAGLQETSSTSGHTLEVSTPRSGRMVNRASRSITEDFHYQHNQSQKRGLK